MKVIKKQVTTTLNIKSKTEIKEEDLLEFTKECEGKKIFNFEVLDSDSDSDYFYYMVTFEETTIL